MRWIVDQRSSLRQQDPRSFKMRRRFELIPSGSVHDVHMSRQLRSKADTMIRCSARYAAPILFLACMYHLNTWGSSTIDKQPVAFSTAVSQPSINLQQTSMSTSFDSRCFVEEGVEYCPPELVGVCCTRSGTTSLANYLNAHPFLSFGG